VRLHVAVLVALFPATLVAQSIDTATYSSLRWRNVGPLRGGRSVAAAGSVARPNEYWMGTTGGGILKSSDGGTTWTPATDKYFGGTIGAVAVAESNPDIVYAGGGEYAIRGNTSHGDGVYKSTDAGKTWTYLGLVGTRHNPKIRVHRFEWDRSDPNAWHRQFKNQARTLCTGDWCILLDCDEFIPEWEFPRLRETLASNDKSIVPVKDRNGLTMLAKDEYPRADTTLEALAKLKPSFEMMGRQFGMDALTKSA